MPELPDVDGHRRLLAEHATGRTVTGVRVIDPELVHGTTPAGLARSLRGRVLAEPTRHGKWLWISTTDEPGPTLVFHFRMTGELVADDTQDTDDPDAALWLVLDRGRIGYRTRRRLGGVSYLRPGVAVETVTGSLGPDALGIERSRLAERLSGRRGGLKSALLNQRVIAGLGNELVDEILWRAHLAPDHTVSEITHQQLRSLHRELGIVLQQSVRAGHVPSGPTWLNAQRGEADPRCPRCERPLRRGKVAGRTTLWCPSEQGSGQ